MAVYRADVVYTETSEVVHFKFIESITIRDDKGPSDDLVIDKLKGDTVLLIRTVSGAEYSISINCIKRVLSLSTCSTDELVSAVFERWVEIHRSQKK